MSTHIGMSLLRTSSAVVVMVGFSRLLAGSVLPFICNDNGIYLVGGMPYTPLDLKMVSTVRYLWWDFLRII